MPSPTPADAQSAWSSGPEQQGVEDPGGAPAPTRRNGHVNGASPRWWSEAHPWAVLDAWAGDWRVVRMLADGLDRRVMLVELDERPAVARLGPHVGRALEWEVTLLEWLARRGVGVPRLVPTRDGASHHGSCLVTEPVDGAPVTTEEDWELVESTLRRLHYVCGGWPQRPGSLAARELLTYEQGGEVDLGAMPPAARRLCRQAWQPLGQLTTTVVHGDPDPANVRIVGDRAVLLDWSRARVDAPVFDLVVLPHDRAERDDELWPRARRAADAWQAARDWTTHPTQARRLLDQLR